MVWGCVGTIYDRVSHRLIGVIDTDLRSNAPTLSLCRTFPHFRKACEILLDGGVASLGGYTMPSLVCHPGLLSVLPSWASAGEIKSDGVVGVVGVRSA